MATTTFAKKMLGLETTEPGVTPPPVGNSTTVVDKELDENLKVCLKCQHHFPIGARERIHSLVETCTFEEIDAEMTSVDVLNFTGVASYTSKLEGYQQSTGLKDAVITGICQIGPDRAGLGVMDFNFLG